MTNEKIILINKDAMRREAIYNELGISNNYRQMLRDLAKNRLRSYALNKSEKMKNKIEKIINSGVEYLNFAAGVNFYSINSFFKKINNK